jgi:hypothetical protein
MVIHYGQDPDPTKKVRMRPDPDPNPQHWYKSSGNIDQTRVWLLILHSHAFLAKYRRLFLQPLTFDQIS